MVVISEDQPFQESFALITLLLSTLLGSMHLTNSYTIQPAHTLLTKEAARKHSTVEEVWLNRTSSAIELMHPQLETCYVLWTKKEY